MYDVEMFCSTQVQHQNSLINALRQVHIICCATYAGLNPVRYPVVMQLSMSLAWHAKLQSQSGNCCSCCCRNVSQACLTLAQQCQLLSAEEAMTSDVAACLAALAAGSSCSGSTSITDTVSSNNASAEPCSDKTCNSSMDSPAATTPDSNSIQQPADADSCQPAAVTGQPAGLPARVATPPGVPGPGRAATEAACTASAARAAQYQQDAQQLLDTVTHMVDATTAHVLLVSKGGGSASTWLAETDQLTISAGLP